MTDLVVISLSPLTLQATSDAPTSLTVTLPPASVTVTPAATNPLTVTSDAPAALTITSVPAPALTITETAPEVITVVAVGPQGPPGGVLIRTQQIVSSTTIVPDSDHYDLIDITALGVAASIAAPLGTPVNGQRLMFRLHDDGTSRGLTWSGSYVSGGVALPSATTAGKVQHLGFFYDSNIAKWMLVAGIIQP